MGEVLSERRHYIALNLLPLASTTVRRILDETPSLATALDLAARHWRGEEHRRRVDSLHGVDSPGPPSAETSHHGSSLQGPRDGPGRQGPRDEPGEQGHRDGSSRQGPRDEPGQRGHRGTVEDEETSKDSNDELLPFQAGIRASRDTPDRAGNGSSPLRLACRRGSEAVREPPALRGLSGLGPDQIARELLVRAGREEARAACLGIAIVTLADDPYPALLREIADPPPVLYMRGDLEPDDEVRLAVVGSRRASRYGLSVADGIGAALAQRGIAVVSGLARGIDAAAHRGALRAGGRTIAVLGSGLERLYPAEHARLADEIRGRGAVVSEYPLDVSPLPQLFPRRNRVISGLSAGTIVVEAAKASGALGTAHLAIEQGRELYVVPGNILSETSEGTNNLLRQGVAHVVTSSQDIVDELPAIFRIRLGLPPSPLDSPSRTTGETDEAVLPLRTGSPASEPTGRSPERSSAAQSLPEGSDERIVLGKLSHDRTVTFDELATLSGLPVPRLLAALSTLEIRGLAVTLPGNRVGAARAPAV